MTLSALGRESVFVGRSSDFRAMRGTGDYKVSKKAVVIVLSDDATDAEVLEAAKHAAAIRHGHPKPPNAKRVQPDE